jgi:hypothetical protein
MRRVWKALATLIVLRLLFVPKLVPLPRIVWLLLLVLTLTYGFSLSFGSETPIHRRFSLGYLMFAGFSYFLAGLFGLPPGWGGIIEPMIWNVLISPYPLLTVLRGIIYSRPFRIDKLPYMLFPVTDQHLWLSITVTLVSVIAMAAAFAMSKNKKLAYHLWFVFVGFSTLEALAYVVATLGRWGIPLYQYNAYSGSKVPISTIVALCWAASYAVAYFIARKGAQLQ